MKYKVNDVVTNIFGRIVHITEVSKEYTYYIKGNPEKVMSTSIKRFEKIYTTKLKYNHKSDPKYKVGDIFKIIDMYTDKNGDSVIITDIETVLEDNVIINYYYLGRERSAYYIQETFDKNFESNVKSGLYIKIRKSKK